MTPLPGGIQQIITRSGTQIYTLEMQAYPGLLVHSFLLLRGSSQGTGQCILVDVGSEAPECARQLAGELDALGALLGRCVQPDTIILTHEHRDHAGGLSLLPARYRAPVVAHEVAARAIRDPLGAHAQSVKAQAKAVRWLGVPQGLAARMAAQSRPLLPKGVPVATELSSGDFLSDWIRAVHVPGHAAGQVALRVDDVLLTADHLLSQNLPPLWPEHAHPGLGLRHYIDSLLRVQAEEGVSISLPSHGLPIEDTYGRVNELMGRIQGKAQKVAAQVARLPGATAFELAQALYPSVSPGKFRLLLGQVAALLEHLALSDTVLEEQRPELPARWWPSGADGRM